uniref:hypothetical protein n=1 Tax=Vaginimicrobium propionicum TaxID=1871034 RepID=UPI0012EC290A|nr:hypothetical protein [Vaginimicrobium propionicum]
MPEQSGQTRYVFAQRLPIWTFVVVGLLVLGGVASLIFGKATVWTVLGVVLIVLGVVVVVLLVMALRATRLEVRLDSSGYTVINGSATTSGKWSEVSEVSATPDGTRVVIRSGKIKRTYISAPRGQWKSLMDELVADLRARLA